MIPLWNKLLDRKRKLENLTTSPATFGQIYITLGQLVNHEQSCTVQWLIGHSNATEEDLLKVEANGIKEGLMKLVTAATQLHAKQKLTQDHLDKPLMTTVLDRCDARYGNRLQFLAKHINSNGNV